MRLITVKILCVLFCVPVYPLVMFAEWYDKRTSFGGKFIFKTASVDYWRDVKETIFYKKEPK